MSTLVEELSQRARALPTEDRARLAEELLASLDDESLEAESAGAWDREIERRVAELRSGAAKLVPAADVHAEARKIYRP